MCLDIICCASKGLIPELDLMFQHLKAEELHVIITDGETQHNDVIIFT